jgi:hypothetical protein
MEMAKRARKAETPKQPSICLRLRAPYFYPDHLESRKVDIAGITGQPDERWMQQMARNVTMEGRAPLATVAICSTIATRSTLIRSKLSLTRVTSNRSYCRPEART